jgi:hypothetical protein
MVGGAEVFGWNEIGGGFFIRRAVAVNNSGQ